jgi:hypothetical protein
MCQEWTHLCDTTIVLSFTVQPAFTCKSLQEVHNHECTTMMCHIAAAVSSLHAEKIYKECVQQILT